MDTFVCDICGKHLSRIQRWESHRVAKHGIHSDVPASSYKRYKVDRSIPVPRTTLYREKRKEEVMKKENDEHISDTNSTYTDDSCCSPSENEERRIGKESTCTDEQMISDTNPESQNTCVSKACEQLTHTSREVEHRESATKNDSVEDLEVNLAVRHSDSPGGATDVHVPTQFEDRVETDSEDLSEYYSDSEIGFSSSEKSSDAESTSDENDEVAEYELSSMTKHEEIYTACMAYSVRHCLNGEARNDLLKMLGLVTDNNPCEYTSKKHIPEQNQFAYNIFDVCSECGNIFPDNETDFRCAIFGCTGLRFKGGESQQIKKQRKSFFATADIKGQIKSVLERDGAWESLSDYRFECEMSDDTLDILSGDLYKYLMSEDQHSDCDSKITLTFNTDGVPLYNSSKISIWPVYLVINELPPKVRFARHNMILWGVWQSKGKPIFRAFFQPFTDDMISLKENGLILDVEQEQIKVKALLIAGTLDLQAKAMVVDMMHHNGEYACITCEVRGEVVKQGRGHARVFPFSDRVPNLRQSDEVLQCGLEGNGHKHAKGIKGVSPLHALGWFDIVKGTVPDYMHGVLLGVTKKMLSLFFTPANNGKPFYIGNRMQEIDARLLAMKPTDDISRLPRSLEQHHKQLKASELQTWLLYYSIPCLLGILPSEYIDHLALMVEGIYILLCDTISEDDLNRADRVLEKFYEQYEHMYGKNNVTLNVHNLGHLVFYVRHLGPLWAWSCFPFEDMNGSLLDHLHGTGNVCAQILRTIHSQKEITHEVRRMSNPVLRDFSQKMVNKHRAVKAKSRALNCDIAGSIVGFIPDIELEQKLMVLFNTQTINKLFKALRIILNDQVFYSVEYSRMEKRISSTIFYEKDGTESVGFLQHFLYHQLSQKCIAVVESAENLGRLHHNVGHLCRVGRKKDIPEVHVIYVEQIKGKLLLMNGNENALCTAKIPNRHGQCS